MSKKSIALSGLTLLVTNCSKKVWENSRKEVMTLIRISLNHCRIVTEKVFINILHCTIFDHLEINMWAQKAFRWFFKSPDPKQVEL